MGKSLIPPACGIAASGRLAWGVQVIWPEAPLWAGAAAVWLAAVLCVYGAYVLFKPDDQSPFMGLDDLVRYVSQRSRWSMDQDVDSPHFNAIVEEAIKEAVGIKGLGVSGRPYSWADGGVSARKSPRSVPIADLDAGQIKVYSITRGTVENVLGIPAHNVIKTADGEGWHEVKFFRPDVERIWRKPRTGLAKIFYGE